MKVFIDTCVFYSQKYNFLENSSFGRLIKYCKLNNIEFLSTDITVKEIQKHLISDLDELFKKHKSLQKETSKYHGFNGTNISVLKTLLDKDDLINESLNEFKNYLTLSNTKILNYDKLNIDEIITSYFNVDLPFENKANKRKEFPDAIARNILINELKNSDTTLIIISHDKGFLRSFEQVGFVETFNGIGDFLNHQNKRVENYSTIQRFYNMRNHLLTIENIFINLVENNDVIELTNLEFDRKGMSHGYDYDNVDIADVSIGDSYLSEIIELSIVDNLITAVCNFTFETEIDAHCRYIDWDLSVWDSENKEYILKEYNYTWEKHIATIDAMYTIKYDLNEKIVIEEQINDDRFTINLDTNTLIEQEHLIDDNIKLIKNEKCGNCNREFPVNYSDYITDQSAWDNGDNKMGYEIEYTIDEQIIYCPFCEQEHAISGTYNEYPVGVIDYENIKFSIK